MPKIAITTNGGMNWFTRNIQGYGYYTAAMDFKNDNLYGLTSAWEENPTFIIRTTNGGNNWTRISNQNFFGVIQALKWVAGSSIWYYCEYSYIRKTSNDGLNWSDMSFPQNDQVTHLDLVSSDNLIYAWATTVNGLIYKLIDSIPTIGIESNSESAITFSLFQNFPNPFNPSTIITYSLAKTSLVKVKVYDAIGREVGTLINNVRETGTHRIEFDANFYKGLSSGIYFYKLEAFEPGTNNVYFSDIKKMILVK
jgi:hypothetical protein